MGDFNHYKPPSTKIPFKKEKKYHVFLSFRGPDVRTAFVDHLYHSLTAAGIHTFLDSEKLEKGQDIGMSLEDAIAHSEILIPIFSPNYAESKWCLKELFLMRSSKNTIIPLFYNVEPWEVRHPDTDKSKYKDAFHKHITQGRHSLKEVNEWKEALEQVSSLSGWSLEATSGYQGNLVKKIVMHVLKTLDIMWLDVAKHPVGLEQRKNELIELLKVDPSPAGRVLTVGIYGMGGLGKTTLAKALFNDIHSRFEASSFVSDVKESAQQFIGLTNLQGQILKDLTRDDFKVNNVDHGKSQMKNRLGWKRALVILDDVDHHKQLDALGPSDCFGEGSRIIVTTRNKHVLNVGQADKDYEMEALEDEQALELFSWHAFLRDCPDINFSDLSQRIVNACKGLPLSLTVIGAHLYDKKDDRECWDEALSRIESLQDEDLYKTLKISYDGLNYEEQQIFLDIACFFLRPNRIFIDNIYDKKSVIKLWKASGWNANTAVKNLTLKSLIRVDKDNFFVMHDHLRDLGRRIVAEESVEEPGKRSRLWHPDDVCRVIKHKEGTARVRGLLYRAWNHSTRSDVKFSTESLVLMTNLQFLSLGGIHIERKMEELPPTLKWLNYSRVTYQSTYEFDEDESAHSLEKRGPESSLSDQIQLYLSGCKLFTLPETLVQLDLHFCFELQRISTMSHMKKLEVLNLSSCTSLAELPELKSLESLTQLQLGGSEELVEVPTLPEGLVDVALEDCSKLQRISTMSHMKKLKFLTLSRCTSLAELPELKSLESLIYLWLYGCQDLVEVPTLPEGLVHVNFQDCSKLQRISIMSHMKKLKFLNLSRCTSLAELPELKSLESLTQLQLGGCEELVEVPTLPEGLVDVNLEDCSKLQRISTMSHMKKLEVLNLSRCTSLAELPELKSLESLTKLQLSGCEELVEVPTLPEGLVHVNLKDCSKLLAPCSNILSNGNGDRKRKRK